MNARLLALNAWSRLRREGDRSFERQLELLRREGAESPRDRELAERIYIGSYQNRELLQAVLRPYAKGKQHPLLQDILLLSAYQLLLMDRIPASAAVNEGVALCRKRLNPGAAATANAILRRVAGLSPENLPLPAPPGTPAYLALRYSHPLWLAEELCDRLGYERARRFLELDNEPPRLTLQRNTLRPLSAALAEALTEAAPCPGVADCFSLPGMNDALRRALEAGDCFIQDLSARLAVLAADPQPGETVLDVCAAPGGKTCSALLAMAGRGRLVAGDLSQKRLDRLAENLDRLGLREKAELRCRDAAAPGAYGDVTADRVLVDAPCSGFGTIRKKPEIRWKIREELEKLPPVQLGILRESGQRVRPGGLLLYSTCTVLRQENEDVIAAFLREAPEFALEPFSLPEPFGPVGEGMVTIWPDTAESDGFFIARLRKRHG